MYRWLKTVQTSTLVFVASNVFIFGTCGVYFLQKKMHNKIRNLPHYEVLKN